MVLKCSLANQCRYGEVSKTSVPGVCQWESNWTELISRLYIVFLNKYKWNYNVLLVTCLVGKFNWGRCFFFPTPFCTCTWCQRQYSGNILEGLNDLAWKSTAKRIELRPWIPCLYPRSIFYSMIKAHWVDFNGIRRCSMLNVYVVIIVVGRLMKAISCRSLWRVELIVVKCNRTESHHQSANFKP